MSKFLDIFSFEEGENNINLVWHPEEIEIDDDKIGLPEDLTLELLCFRHGLEISCTGRVQTTVILECVRCLEKFEYHLNEPIDFIVRLAAGAPLRDKLWNEDVVRLDQYGGKLDLTPRIHDAILLGIPQYPLCSEDCRGLCPVCGANLNKTKCEHYQQKSKKNIDERWEKLRTLIKLDKK